MHLELFPSVPAAWRDAALSEKWDKIRRVRSVVTGALEIERAAKRMGASLEAAPQVFIEDAELLEAFHGVDASEVFITSEAALVAGKGSAGAFTIPDMRGIAVVPLRVEGRKCARSWRYTQDVGSDPRYPELSARDAKAVAEIDGASS